MYLSIILLILSAILLLYVFFDLAWNYNLELTEYRQRKIVLLLALIGAIGLQARAIAYAEVNYDFNILEGKFDYSVKNRNR